jgi:anthranilate synthase component 1
VNTPIPVVRSLGQWRPDLLRAHEQAPELYPFVLESASVGTRHGRYDLLLAATPGIEPLVLHADQHLSGPGAHLGRFLDALDHNWREAQIPQDSTQTLPFLGGWFLYLGYELAAEIEPSLTLPRGALPIAVATRVAAAAIYDHETGETWLVAEQGHADALDGLQACLHPVNPADAALAPIGSMVLTEDDPAHYQLAVRRALEHIAAGDIYQANLAREWRGVLASDASAARLYGHLRRANPGPFAALALLPGMTVLSTSPERLVSSRDGRVETRPIAGTRPRRGDDAAMAAELRANKKEQAEHVMLLDLERNDLGRICEAGTVEVDEYMSIESYAHVHHIVSNVRGQLRGAVTPGQIIRAVFPGGTITGCPKVRCMQLIATLEAKARGAYTGSLGYLGRDGTLDLNILIRTATITQGLNGVRELSLKAGAGIVADSDPERELDETRAKARGLIRGLGAERS